MKKVTPLTFARTPHGNDVLQGDGFIVSYKDMSDGSTTNPFSELESMLQQLGEMSGFDEAQPETALITDADGRKVFRILNGDFRREYAGIAEQGIDACIAFYESQQDEYGSHWSTDLSIGEVL